MHEKDILQCLIFNLRTAEKKNHKNPQALEFISLQPPLMLTWFISSFLPRGIEEVPTYPVTLAVCYFHNVAKQEDKKLCHDSNIVLVRRAPSGQ